MEYKPTLSTKSWPSLIFSCRTEYASALEKTFQGEGEGGFGGHFKLFEQISVLHRVRQVCIGQKLSWLIQTCPNMIKLIQIRSNLFKLAKLVQIGSNLSKLDQICQTGTKQRFAIVIETSLSGSEDCRVFSLVRVFFWLKFYFFQRQGALEDYYTTPGLNTMAPWITTVHQIKIRPQTETMPDISTVTRHSTPSGLLMK